MSKQLDNLLIKVKSRLYEKIPTWWAKQYGEYKKSYNRVKFNLFLSTMSFFGAIFGLEFLYLSSGATLFAIITSGVYFCISMMIFLFARILFDEEKKFEGLVKQQMQLNDIAAYEFCEQFMSQYLNNSAHKTNGELHDFDTSLDTSLDKDELQDLMSISFNKAQLEALAYQMNYYQTITLNDLCRIQNIKEKEYLVEEYKDIFNQFAQDNALEHSDLYHFTEQENEISYKKYL